MNALPACLGLTLAIGLSMGCSSSSSPSLFNGTWSCKQQSTLSYTSPANAPNSTHDTTLTLVISANDGDPITLDSAPTDAGMLGDAGTGCSLTFDTSGSTATLAPGQTCPFTFPVGSASLTGTLDFSSGTGSVSGNTLTFSSTSTFNATLKSGAVSIAYAGTDNGSSTCTR
jgi:hypothetical protein